MDIETSNEYDRLRTYANANGDASALKLAADDIIKLRRQLADAQQVATWPPASVQEALNSGDGTYRP